LTGYDDAHIRRLIGDGRLPALKRGGVWFLDKQKVLEYAEEMRKLGTAKSDGHSCQCPGVAVLLLCAIGRRRGAGLGALRRTLSASRV
jgi:hypothetical protein